MWKKFFLLCSLSIAIIPLQKRTQNLPDLRIPDLAVTEITIPSNVVCEENTQFSYTVKNIGSQATNRGQIPEDRFFMIKETVDKSVIGYQKIDTLLPPNNAINLRSKEFKAKAGNHSFGVTIVYAGTERDKGNNEQSKTFYVNPRSISLNQKILNDIISRNVKIKIERGENQSFVQFRDKSTYFTVPDFVKTVGYRPALKWPPWKEIKVTEYPHNINSNSLILDIKPSYVELRITFEEEDEEIHGTWHGEIWDLIVSIVLRPEVVRNELSYATSSVQVGCVFNLDLKGIPEDLPKDLLDIDVKGAIIKHIANQVEQQVVKFMQSDEARAGFTNIFMDAVKVFSLGKIAEVERIEIKPHQEIKIWGCASGS